MKEYITKREIFEAIRGIREKYEGKDIDTEQLEKDLIDLETSVLMDAR